MTSPTLVGVSLKMYFGHAQTLDWIARVGELARTHPAVVDGTVELFVIPSFVSIVPTIAALEGSRVLVGAQDLATEDAGAFTGEVSGGQIRELGGAFVEVGHAERRRLFGETDAVVRRKADAALRAGLVPMICLGEESEGDPADAARECVRQLDDALALAAERGHGGRIVVAYEPRWAIGAAEPASDPHIRVVCRELRAHVGALDAHPGSAVVYGGSAGPGLLTRIGDDVDGLFLGRFAHDPRAVAAILDEVHARAAARPASDGSR